MKGFPRGWKLPKKKFHKAPTPPPNQVHDSLKKKSEERRDWKREIDQEMKEEAFINCDMCNCSIPASTIGQICEECDQRILEDFEGDMSE